MYNYHTVSLLLAGVTELLMAPGKFPGSSGTRNLHDNLSDLRAQVAANQKVWCTALELLTVHFCGVNFHGFVDLPRFCENVTQ